MCDRRNNRIQIFSATGEFIKQWVDVRLPTDLHMDGNDIVYVAERPDNETLENWISVRDKSGNVLARWDTPRSHQIWVDRRGDIYLVAGLRGLPPRGAAIKYSRIS